jgi:membrane protein
MDEQLNRMAGVSPSAKTFTPKQGQYLAYIHLYTRLHRRPPAETDMLAKATVTSHSTGQNHCDEVLALFPGIAALVAIYGLVADPSTISQHLNDLSAVMPGGATEIIGDQLQRLTSQPSGKLGFALLSGVVVSLWSANAGMKALFDALNVVYGEKERRNFIRLNVVPLVFTLGAILLLMIALAAIAVLPVVLGYLGLSTATEWLIVCAARSCNISSPNEGPTVRGRRFRPSTSRTRRRWPTILP